MSEHSAEIDAASTTAIGRAVATFAGALSVMHENLGRLQGKANSEDARDIDSARVYMEAAFWKFETVLARQMETSVIPPDSGRS